MAADEDFFPQSLSGFDLAAGLVRLQGNQRLYKKLLLDFSTNYAKMADEIRKALDAEDMDQAHSLVHGLKGVAGNLAASGLHTATIEMEKLIKQSATSQRPPKDQVMLNFQTLEKELERTLESVRTLAISELQATAETPEGVTADLPPETALEAASRIREAVDMGDVTELKSVAEELTSQTELFSPFGKEIIQLAENFDFDGITQLADKLESQAK
jgi:HPt (histidine-containing phosphotransfer) domain-containing protein